ncbi:MAG TPA: hypothetical protein VD929_05365 [Caulobacteraceae bacterium]|nr:hypothetical protein [Caulobacteraceae bacterium]
MLVLTACALAALSPIDVSAAPKKRTPAASAKPSPYAKWGITETELRTAGVADLLAKAGFPARLPAAQTSADKGDVVAMTLVGLAYVEGYGVTRDYEQGRKYLELAAAELEPRAVHGMGVLYANGWGVKKNQGSAKAWFDQEQRLLGGKPGAPPPTAGSKGGGLLASLGGLASAKQEEPPKTDEGPGFLAGVKNSLSVAINGAPAAPQADKPAPSPDAPPPTTVCRQAACWGVWAQITGVKYSHKSITGYSDFKRFDWVVPGKRLKVLSPGLAVSEYVLDPKTRMPQGHYVETDGSVATNPHWDPEKKLWTRLLWRAPYSGRLEHAIQHYKNGKWRDWKDLGILDVYTTVYKSEDAIRQAEQDRSAFWSGVVQSAEAINRGIDGYNEFNAPIDAIAQQGEAQRRQMVEDARRAEEQRQAQEAQRRQQQAQAEQQRLQQAAARQQQARQAQAAPAAPKAPTTQVQANTAQAAQQKAEQTKTAQAAQNAKLAQAGPQAAMRQPGSGVAMKPSGGSGSGSQSAVAPKKGAAWSFEVVDWDEAMVVCKMYNAKLNEYVCYGPLQNTWVRPGKPNWQSGVAQACSQGEELRDLGEYRGWLVFGCGYGKRPGTEHENPNIKHGLGPIPGQRRYRCARNVSSCKTVAG